MSQARGKRVAISTAVIGVLVLIFAVFIYWQSTGRFLPWKFSNTVPQPSNPLPQSPTFAGTRVDIMNGKIPVSEFSSFLEDYTGLSVVVDSEVSQKIVDITTSVKNADAEVVRALLQANGCDVNTETLPNGRQIVRIKSSKGQK